MGTFGAMANVHIRRLLARSESKYALTAMLAIVLVAFAESCMRFYGADAGEIPSAAYAWIGNMDNMQIQASRVLYFYLIFLLASLVFSDSFYVDAKNGTSVIAATRCTMKTYFASMGAVAFFGGFFVVLVPLLASQCLAFLAFPVWAEPNAFSGVLNSPAQDSHWALLASENVLFPELYFNHPYLNNLVYIAYVSLWAGIASLASFAISLYYRRQRLVVLGAPTLIYLVSLFVMPRNFALSYYLYPGIFLGGMSKLFFFIAPIAVLAVLVVAIAAAMRKRDVLL